MSWRRALVLASVLLGAAGCGRYEEILRVPSPDGVVEAVVVEVEAGGGNPFAYQVHVVARGARWHKGRERLIYTDPVRFRVAWADARHLELCYDDAHIYPSSNRPEPKASQSPQDLVELKLVKPASACSTPAPRS
ncbi:MAG TPA: hypothetical protein VNF03_20345 [Patescibacteria group bacterium]|jgi:hypothetical protein|nr:hypothetical protein [Patescibacteria group bacterium]